MTTLLLFVLFALGLIGGFFSGLLGIGGGIIMILLLLYVPLLETYLISLRLKQKTNEILTPAYFVFC